MAKRLTMMILRNIFIFPIVLFRLFRYAKNDKLSEQKKYELIRVIGTKGCKGGNVRVHGYGLEHLKSQSGYIMYPNHQGLFDVMGLVDIDTVPFSVVIKKEAYRVFGLREIIQTMGGLFIDRDDVRQGLKVINEVARQVQNGRNFLIFPEGTRSKNGNHMGEFKGGSFKAALKAKCPIIPIAFIDTYLPFDTNSIKKVDVQIHVLEPIPYEEYQGMKTAEIAAMVKERIQKTIDENEHRFENKL